MTVCLEKNYGPLMYVTGKKYMTMVAFFSFRMFMSFVKGASTHTNLNIFTALAPYLYNNTNDTQHEQCIIIAYTYIFPDLPATHETCF
mmetsp:Transcript_5317/g.7303  ORF Transcript_5317/g.7303 Transcript_5317/m.7303 type:complete len:88 (-) Transcript_5317:252-515(-)